MQNRPHAIFFAAILLAAPIANASTIYTWNVLTGNWSLDSNWSPVHVPNDSINDDATINSGAATSLMATSTFTI